MLSPQFRRRWMIGAGLVVVILAILLVWGNSYATRWIESPKFVEMLDKETSKGLKLEGHYAPLHRVGLLGMRGDGFTGQKGYKTIVTLQANRISGVFNPLGFFLQRWELDDLHMDSGTVMLQKTEATPGAPKGATPRPWWGYFWPYRVHLADVKVPDANILWKLQDKESGIYGTFLEITPNGRDFEYDARGGEFKTPMTPHLVVQHAHLLIRKPRLYCPEFILGDDEAHPEEQIRMTGDAGLQDDRSMHLKIDLAGLNVSPWMPEKLRAHVQGHASGHLDYESTGTGLESAKGQGNLEILNGLLRDLPQVHQYMTVTGSPDPGNLPLKVCRMDMHWEEGSISAEKMEVESDGVFRLEGNVTIGKDKSLRGELELGLTDPYLKWLPTAKQAIFIHAAGGYHFATIHLSGTTKKPVQDLTPRVMKEIEKSPLLGLKLFFNQAGEWFSFE